MKGLAGRLWQVLWRPAASLALLALLFWFVPLGAYREVFAGIDLWLGLAALALVLPMALTKATIFWLAARVQGLFFTVRQMLAIQLTSAFYTLVVPGQLGGTVSRWYKMQKPGRQPIEAAAVMLMARVLETSTACLMGLALALLDARARELLVVPIALVLVLGVAGGLPLLMLSRTGRRLARLAVDSLPAHRWFQPLRRALPQLRDAALRMRHIDRSVIAVIVALSLLWNGLGILSITLAAEAVAADVGWITLGWMRALLAVILLLPLAWGGLGVREASVVALLQPYGVAPAAAVAIGAVVSLRNILEAVIGGLVELAALWSGRRRTATS